MPCTCGDPTHCGTVPEPKQGMMLDPTKFNLPAYADRVLVSVRYPDCPFGSVYFKQQIWCNAQDFCQHLDYTRGVCNYVKGE